MKLNPTHSLSSKLWPDMRIRQELRRLDTITGLHGGDLTICYTKDERALGCFSRNMTGNLMFFQFSLVFFDDPYWPEEAALEVIRHEYAHYMDFVENKGESHGESWQECCRRIGVPPSVYYDSSDFERKKKAILQREEEKARRQKEAMENALLTIRYGEYNIGTIINHPVWGKGMVIGTHGEGAGRAVKVRFASLGEDIKELNVAWIDMNCR